MSDVLKKYHEEIDKTLADLDIAIKRVRAGRTTQIAKTDDRDYFKSLSYSWFHSRSPNLVALAPNVEIDHINELFTQIMNATARKAARSTYLRSLNKAREGLISLRSTAVDKSIADTAVGQKPVPDFSPLVGDKSMQSILEDRWFECQRCISAKAYLAATVMMGGLLEALFVAYANKLPDKSKMFTCKLTPKESKTNKPLALTQWTLRPYIDVGHELGWITRSGKDVAEVLRDYRNYVHPQKQRSHGVVLNQQDSEMFWDVTQHLTRQLLSHASKPQP